MFDLFVKIPGPQFLPMFAGLSVVCILAAWWWTRDMTGKDLLPKLPDSDMLSVAMLRGGQKEVIRTVVFDMWSRNLIRITGKGSNTEIEIVPRFDIDKLGGPVHHAIYEYVIVSKKISYLFSDKQFLTTVEPHLRPVSENLKNLRLLRNRKDIARALQAFIAAFIVIAGTGGTKMALGIMRGKPVGFLAIMLIVSFIALFVAVLPDLIHPTNLGKRYLRSLRERFKDVRNCMKNNELHPDISPAFVMAVFGIGILAGAELYKPFGNAFAHSEGGSLGGCGGGCGGGGGSGSGGGASGGGDGGCGGSGGGGGGDGGGSGGGDGGGGSGGGCGGCGGGGG